jgi:thiamine-phosphate pyrophosphorylase
MPLDPKGCFPVMCLTLDGTGVSHSEQAARLCAAGARWVQLRMKQASMDDWVAQARASVAACREHGALLIVNDSVDVALESGADGVHLGVLDEEWSLARTRLGAGRILGGTVNNAGEARRAVDSGSLDYVGVGPLRFTATKERLSPVLGLEGIRELIALLGDLPAWAIGGVEAEDLPSLRDAGASGVAVASALVRGGKTAENLGAFLRHWARQPLPLS